MTKKVLVSATLFALAAFGCGKKEEGGGKPAPSPTPPPAKTEPAKTDNGAPTNAPPTAAGTATITGKIAFEGTAPKMDDLPRQSDPFCAKTKMASDNVVVNGGGVKGTLVRLPVGAAKGAAPAEPVVVDQKNCMYEPKVSGIVSGQKVSVKNSDGTTHNIHSYLGDETKFNEAQPAGAPNLDKEVDVEAGNEPLHLKCDVHAWMEGWVVVTDHPYFAVSGDDGSFKIEKVPAGTYKLEAWHPKLGMKTVEVTVKDGETVEAKFPAFKPEDYKK